MPAKPTATAAPAQRPLRAWLRRLASLAAVVFLLLWLAGWTLTDRTIFTQYLWWAGLPLLLLSVALVAAAILLRVQPRRARTHPLVWLVTLAFLLEFSHQLNVRSLFTSSTSRSNASLHIVQCNLGLGDIDAATSRAVAQRLTADGKPDILLLSIANYQTQWRAYLAAMGDSPSSPIAAQDLFERKVFSRHKILSYRNFIVTTQPAWSVDPPDWARSALTSILSTGGIRPRDLERFEPTFIHCVTLDTTAKLGRPFTLYYIDYPSSPLLRRAAVAAAVRERINLMLRPTISGEIPTPLPDLIIGDFNTPRGSASLRTIMPGYSPATDAAGLGLLGTFPRGTPLLHIDNALVSPEWRATDYATIDPGIGEHRGQSLRLSPAP